MRYHDGDYMTIHTIYFIVDPHAVKEEDILCKGPPGPIQEMNMAPFSGLTIFHTGRFR